MKMIGNVSDWLSYAGGALIKVADSAGSTVNYDGPKSLMLHTKFRGNRPTGSGEEDF